MKHNRIIKQILPIAVILLTAISTSAQRYYSPNVSIGGKAGVTLSEMGFSPGIRQSMLMGKMAGITFRYTEERNFGLIAELNIEQRGWQEAYEELPFQYKRTLTYIQLPLLTHIYFGSNRVKGFFNLGPEIGYMITSSITSNFDYTNTSTVANYPSNRMTEQLYTPINNKFDYGISAGAGLEVFVTRKHSIQLEGRFYYGLGNIFPSSKADTFAASRNMSVMITLGYMFRLK